MRPEAVRKTFTDWAPIYDATLDIARARMARHGYERIDL